MSCGPEDAGYEVAEVYLRCADEDPPAAEAGLSMGLEGFPEQTTQSRYSSSGKVHRLR